MNDSPGPGWRRQWAGIAPESGPNAEGRVWRAWRAKAAGKDFRVGIVARRVGGLVQTAEPSPLMTIIRSSANAVLKRARAVAAGRERSSILLEGERLVRDALEAGARLEALLVSEDRAELLEELLQGRAECEGRLVEAGLLAAVSNLKTAPGVIALAQTPATRPIDGLSAGAGSRVVVAAGIADPGNLGALARSAEATGCEALVVIAGGARPWNEKALRGSMGSLLRVPVVEAESVAAASQALTAKGYRSLRAATRGGIPFDECDWTGPLALWFPGETGELPPEIAAFEGATIPMSGRVESLNVSVAAAVLLFAAARSRERAS